MCRVNADGSGQQTIAAGDYRSPSVSLDGAHTAWIQSTADLFTGDSGAGSPVGPITRYAAYAVISPDGTKVLAFEAAGQPTRVCVYDVGGGPCASQGGGAITSAGWYPGNRVMVSTRDSNDPAFQAHAQYYNNEICLEVAAGGGQCEQTLARDTDYQLDDPALSPDGTTLAVSRAPWDHQDQGQIALYDVATQTLKAVLTAGPGDETPFWSPDGSQIAFSRAGGIYVVSAAGSPGSETRIADGDSPTWSNVGGSSSSSGGGSSSSSGGGSSSGGSTGAPGGATSGGGAPKLAVTRTQHGTKVHGRVTVPAAGARVVIQLVAQGYVVGKKVIKSAPAGTRPFTVALAAKLVKALRSRHVHRLTVRVAVSVAGTVVQRTVTLRL